MPEFTILTVCLPAAVPVGSLAAAASAALAAHGITDAGPAGHFFTTARLRTSNLVQPYHGTAAGGPVKLLDLERMRADAHLKYWNRHELWQQVTGGSPVARPWWHFYDRYLASPDTYTWDHAVQGFLNQPRITCMRTYNSHPHRLTNLPIEHLDAFEAGPQAYAVYGWLSAVPCQGLLTLDGALLRSASARHTDQLTYLQQANERITALAATDHLVAFATH
ncbi:hypothetical protein Rhe02_37560 [Rhizocola hellebori]|uniref:Uncharacterized protein n=1 Tax=Rhizocola hellebori TaxID=1392758 RepID=A0A8J3Q922_9ACTN|nr:hypothetical protein [Rhizocola hellebori]GIH05689.1 hypothetical protein Rhe02_37560 [Rhizocola hellebori]